MYCVSKGDRGWTPRWGVRAPCDRVVWPGYKSENANVSCRSCPQNFRNPEIPLCHASVTPAPALNTPCPTPPTSSPPSRPILRLPPQTMPPSAVRPTLLWSRRQTALLLQSPTSKSTRTTSTVRATNARTNSQYRSTRSMSPQPILS